MDKPLGDLTGFSRSRTPALERLGYFYDPEAGTFIVKEKRGRRRMPRRMILARMAEWDAEQAARPSVEDSEPLPF